LGAVFGSLVVGGIILYVLKRRKILFKRKLQRVENEMKKYEN
jgi:hypothetical protein